MVRGEVVVQLAGSRQLWANLISGQGQRFIKLYYLWLYGGASFGP